MEPDYLYDCGEGRVFGDFRELWLDEDLPRECEVTRLTTAPPSKLEKKALRIGDVGVEYLYLLYRTCASTRSWTWTADSYSPDQAQYMSGALLICPDHPLAEVVQPLIDDQSEAVEAMVRDDKMTAEGKLIASGSYLVGEEIVPGTWKSEGERVEDCYWEVSAADGSIVDNAFIRIAPQITVTIPASAAGFTAQGCSFRWVGP